MNVMKYRCSRVVLKTKQFFHNFTQIGINTFYKVPCLHGCLYGRNFNKIYPGLKIISLTNHLDVALERTKQDHRPCLIILSN